MSKKEILIQNLKIIIENQEKLETFLIENSNLPGPRANLELVFALSESYTNIEVLMKWAKIDVTQADTNHPKSFLPICAAVCLGRQHTKNPDEKIVTILKKMANDDRWRIREAVAFGFQLIGEKNFSELKRIFSAWLKESNNREKRAILVSLAHPKFLDRNTTLYCFKILEDILNNLQRDDDFEILSKGLKFTISVFAAAHPEVGFSFMEKWMGKEKAIDDILKSNLKKNRLLKNHSKETAKILEKMEDFSYRI